MGENDGVETCLRFWFGLCDKVIVLCKQFISAFHIYLKLNKKAMNPKKRITTNFRVAKFFAALVIVLSFILFASKSMSKTEKDLEGLAVFLSITLMAGLLWLLALTRNVVYYDEAFFYIYNWRGRLVETVSIEKIATVYNFPIHGFYFWTTYCVRYYDDPSKGRVFYMLIGDTTNLSGIIELIKQKNKHFIVD